MVAITQISFPLPKSHWLDQVDKNLTSISNKRMSMQFIMLEEKETSKLYCFTKEYTASFGMIMQLLHSTLRKTTENLESKTEYY